MATREQEYLKLKAWCEQPNIFLPCPESDDQTKAVNRLWEEFHYCQVRELDILIESLEGREHISSTKESALKKLRPWLEKVFGSSHRIVDPEFVVRDRQRNQRRAERKGKLSALESDELSTTKEEDTMSNDETEVTTKKSAAKKGKLKKEAAAPASGGIGLADIAKKVKVDPADLRRALRASKIKKPAGSWNWPKGHADLKAVEKLASSLK